MILIDKPLIISGIGNPVIDGLKKGHVFYIRSDDVTLQGLTIQNSGMSYSSEYAGIRIEESKRCKILKNQLSNNTYSIYLAHVDGCLVENNHAVGNAKDEVSGGNGLHLWYSKNINVFGNTFSHHRDGLYFEFSGDSDIERNLSQDNIRYGMHFMYSHNNRYINNTFSHNQTGVAVMYSKKVEMRGNRFEKSWGRVSYGLLLKDIGDSHIEGNTFEDNTVGIVADGASRNSFLKNQFIHNGWGVRIWGNTEANIFSENNFISNYFDVSSNSMSQLNTFASNFWSDYGGYDLNHDGTGDVPFRPMKIFDVWIGRYPEVVVLLASPMIEFLEMAEKVFPVLTPKTLLDEKPQMHTCPT